jgi:3-phenylpropionate/trans-cinnamate dioxygenase subunit alpha
MDAMTSTTRPIAESGACGGACSSPVRGATQTPRGTLRRPVAMTRNIDVSGLVDAEGGLLDRAIFTDEELYRQELRRVFAPSWLFLAHTDQFHKPGDFFTTYMGEDPVIVTLDKNRNIRAYLNSCRHRGARVCRADFGTTRSFTCTYHGWAYDLDGKLVSIPNVAGYSDFDAKDWGLVEVPHVDSYHGLIFGTWNPEPVPLRESLGDMAWYMDAMLDHDDEGTVVVGGVHKWVLEGNWKLAAEQFATDWYHVNTSHGSALTVLTPAGKGPRDEIVHRTGRQYVDPNGHGAGFPVHPKNRFDARTVHEWMDYRALRDRLGDARVEGPLTNGHATVFPNFSYLPVNGSIRIWHPRGPDAMEVWAWTIVDKSMPDEVRDAQRLYNLRTFGPSGIFEQDDGENWSEVQAISHGFITNGVALNYQMGIGSERRDGRHPGTTSELYSDAAGRAFYARWRDLMNTPAWHEDNS